MQPVPPPLSADQHRIVFVSRHEGHSELYLVHADGSGLIRLTDIGEEAAPAWSPDGQWIAFQSVSDEGRQSHLYKIRPDGSQLTRLTDTPAYDNIPAWSSDGLWIAFQSHALDAPNSKTSSPSALYKIPAGGGVRQPLDLADPATVDMFQLASPNGQLLLNNWLLRTPAGGYNDLSQRLDDTNSLGWITWAPDRQYILFASSRDYQTEMPGIKTDIYLSRADSGERVRLTNDPAKEMYLSWSPDGMKIAFISYLQGQSGGVDIMNADGSERQRLVEDRSAQNLIWSPDGQYLAFESDYGSIVTMSVDGHRIAVIPVMADSPAWAPR